MSEPGGSGGQVPPGSDQIWPLAEQLAAQQLPVRIAGELSARQARGAVAMRTARLPSELTSGGLRTLADDMELTAPEPDWAIEKLALRGHMVSLPSLRKTGKTTLLGNAAHCGADNEPFLGQFPCKLDGRIVVWNCEMEPYDAVLTYRQLGTRNTSRIVPWHMKGRSLPFLHSDALSEWLVSWLRWAECEWLILDPWKDVCRWNAVNPNDGADVSELLGRIREIQHEAGLSLVIVAAHITQAGALSGAAEGSERAKGAGEFEDGVDVMWRYFRESPRRDAPRLLSVEGRGGTGLDETEVMFDAGTSRLALGNGDRHMARDRAAAAAAMERLTAAAMMLPPGEEAIWTSNQAAALIGGSKNDALAALAACEMEGLLTCMHPGRRGQAAMWSFPQVVHTSTDTGR